MAYKRGGQTQSWGLSTMSDVSVQLWCRERFIEVTILKIPFVNILNKWLEPSFIFLTNRPSRYPKEISGEHFVTFLNIRGQYQYVRSIRNLCAVRYNLLFFSDVNSSCGPNSSLRLVNRLNRSSDRLASLIVFSRVFLFTTDHRYLRYLRYYMYTKCL